MNLQTDQIKHIRDTFIRMKTKDDFLALMNYAKSCLYNEASHPFEIRHVNYHSNPKNADKRYKNFQIRKKSGGARIIHSPNNGLKQLQKALNIILQSVYTVNPSATGFIPGKSILDNAKVHVGSNYVFNIDLLDFFPSIDQARIWARLKVPPFNLNKDTNRLQLANIIAALCCHEMEVTRVNDEGEPSLQKRNVLPQGAPTSPVISNIICQQLDFYLNAVAKRFGLKYTRYADDITFSSMHNVYHQEGPFRKELSRVIATQNFRVNEKKTRLQDNKYRQEVTGIVVNTLPNVPLRYVKQLRMWLYYWEQYGYEKTYSWFCYEYNKDKGHVKKMNPDMSSVLAGKLDYLKMIKGHENSTYLKLKDRFDNLDKRKRKVIIQRIELNKESSANHFPVETVRFLKHFKYDSEFSFKNLVHTPVDDKEFDFRLLLKTTNNEFKTFTRKDENGKLDLPKNVILGVNELMLTLGKEGMAFFNKKGEHPIHDNYVGGKIQSFKRDYRFANEKSESSILSELITNILYSRKHTDNTENKTYAFSELDTSGLFAMEQVKFLPDIRMFQIRANFFTWVPNIRSTLIIIIDNILKHSNIKGNRYFSKEEKEIPISIERFSEGDNLKIALSILDKNSLYLGQVSPKLIPEFRRDFAYYLISVADFKIQFDTVEEESYEFSITPYSNEIKKIDHPVGGFKYTFTFYD